MDKQRGKQRDESQQRDREELLPFSETLIKTCASSCLRLLCFLCLLYFHLGSPRRSRPFVCCRVPVRMDVPAVPSISTPQLLHTISFSPLNSPGLHCLHLTLRVTQNTLQISTEIPDRLWSPPRGWEDESSTTQNVRRRKAFFLEGKKKLSPARPRPLFLTTWSGCFISLWISLSRNLWLHLLSVVSVL